MTKATPNTYNSKTNGVDCAKNWIVDGKKLRFRPRIKKELRFKVIDSKYGTCSFKELALFCGVSPNTLTKDLKEWRAMGREDALLDEKWWVLFNSPDISQRDKFNALTMLQRVRMMRAEIERTLNASWKNDHFEVA